MWSFFCSLLSYKRGCIYFYFIISRFFTWVLRFVTSLIICSHTFDKVTTTLIFTFFIWVIMFAYYHAFLPVRSRNLFPLTPHFDLHFYLIISLCRFLYEREYMSWRCTIMMNAITISVFRKIYLVNFSHVSILFDFFILWLYLTS